MAPWALPRRRAATVVAHVRKNPNQLARLNAAAAVWRKLNELLVELLDLLTAFEVVGGA